MLATTKLNNRKVSFSKSLIDSYINHDEFGFVDIVLKEYNDAKKKKKSISSKFHELIKTFHIPIKQCYLIACE